MGFLVVSSGLVHHNLNSLCIKSQLSLCPSIQLAEGLFKSLLSSKWKYVSLSDLLQVVMAIKCRGEQALDGLYTGINTQHIIMASKMVHYPLHHYDC